MIVKEFYDSGLYAFYDGFASWEEAIHASIQPLVDKGIVDKSYGDEIIDSVHKYGPYINISESICIPHAGITESVHGTGMSMMITKDSVNFGENSEFKPRIFFAFCSTDVDAHLERLEKLSDFCSDEDRINELMLLHCKEDLEEYLRRRGEQV